MLQILHEFPSNKRFHTDSGHLGAKFLQTGLPGQWARATTQQVQLSSGRLVSPRVPSSLQSQQPGHAAQSLQNQMKITAISQSGDFLVLAGVCWFGSALVLYQQSSGRQILLKTGDPIKQLETGHVKSKDGQLLLNIFVLFQGGQAFRLSCLVSDFDSIDSAIDSFVLDFSQASAGPFQLSFIRQAERLFFVNCTNGDCMLFLLGDVKLDGFKIGEFDLDLQFSIQLNIKKEFLQSVDVAYSPAKSEFYVVVSDTKHGVTVNTFSSNNSHMHRVSQFSTQTKHSAQIWNVSKVCLSPSGDLISILFHSEDGVETSRIVSVDLKGGENEVVCDMKISGYATPVFDIYHQQLENGAVNLMCLFFHQLAMLPVISAVEHEELEISDVFMKYYVQHGKEMKKNIDAQRAKHDLIIDILLKKFGINPVSFYPPTNEKQLRQLITLVDENAEFGETEKNCLKYYLEYPVIDAVGDDSFAFSSLNLPAKMKHVIAGYLKMDFGNYAEAVKYLVSSCTTSLIDFPDLVLEILLNHGSKQDVDQFVEFFYRNCNNALRPLMNIDFETAFVYARGVRRMAEFIELTVDCGLEHKLCSLPLSLEEEQIIRDKSSSSKMKWLLALYYFTHSRFQESLEFLTQCQNRPEAHKLVEVIQMLKSPFSDFPVVNAAAPLQLSDSVVWKPSKPFEKTNLSVDEAEQDVDMELADYKHVDTPLKQSPKKQAVTVENSPRLADRRLSQYHLRRLSTTGKNMSPFSQLNDNSYSLRKKRQQEFIFASDVAEEVEQLAIEEEKIPEPPYPKQHAKRKQLLSPVGRDEPVSPARHSPCLRSKSMSESDEMEEDVTTAMSELRPSPKLRNKSPPKSQDKSHEAVTTDEEAEYHDLSVHVETPSRRSPRLKSRLTESTVAAGEDERNQETESEYEKQEEVQSEADEEEEQVGWFGKLSSWLTPHRPAPEKRMRTITTESEHRQRLAESNDKRIRSMNTDQAQKSRSRSTSPGKSPSVAARPRSVSPKKNSEETASPRRSPRKQVEFASETELKQEDLAHRLTRRKPKTAADDTNEESSSTGGSRSSSAPTSTVSTPAANEKAARQRALRKTASEAKQNITLRQSSASSSAKPTLQKKVLKREKHSTDEDMHADDPQTPRQNENGIVSRRMLTRSMRKSMIKSK